MNLERYGPLAGALVYSVAVFALLGRQSEEVPGAVRASLEVRHLTFMAHFLPFGDEDLRRELGNLGLDKALENQVRKPLATDLDRWRAACLALGLGSRHLVPVFLAPMADSDPLARRLIEWSFDPAARADRADVDALAALAVNDHLNTGARLALLKDGGLDREQAIAGEHEAWWGTVLRTATFILLGLGIAVIGMVLWARSARTMSVPASGDRLTWETVVALASPFVYMIAVMVSERALSAFPDVQGMIAEAGGLAVAVTAMYVVNGVFGLVLVGWVGRVSVFESWSDNIGLRGSFKKERLVGSIGWGIGAYCMAVPAVFAASTISSGIFGDGGEPFDNPVAVLLVTRPGNEVAVLVFAAAVLAPIFEEPLFRGFLFGRLRRHLTPVSAAMWSGLVFAAAHMSLANLLPLWALGFTLAVVYDRRRDLLAPMLAHALWNLVSAFGLLAIYG